MARKRDIADEGRIRDTTVTKKARPDPDPDKTAWTFRVHNHIFATEEEAPFHILYSPDDSAAAAHFVAELKAHFASSSSSSSPAIKEEEEEEQEESTAAVIPRQEESSSSSGAALEQQPNDENADGSDEEEEEEEEDEDDEPPINPEAKMLGLLMHLAGEPNSFYNDPEDRPDWLPEGASVGVFRTEHHSRDPSWHMHAPPYQKFFEEGDYD